jgi:uncharacterized protein (TIGR04255 family)
VFTAEDPGITNIGDLNYSVRIAGTSLIEPQNINYRRTRSRSHLVQVRIASPEFVSGSIKKTVQVLVDLDVFTLADFETNDSQATKEWIEDAHAYEKEEFFRLFTAEMRQRLVEVE